ncbi:MAG: hypothetical protein AAFN77_05355 [Planctomycetota bacterium]
MAGPSATIAQTAPDRNRLLDSSAINSPQVAVLKNGEIMTGNIQQDHSRIVIKIPSGSVIPLPRSRVEFISDSLQQAYWEKLARVKAADVNGQVQLFQWCIKHQLVAQAGNQIDILSDLNIDAVSLDRLNQKYHLAREQLLRVPSMTPRQPDLLNGIAGESSIARSDTKTIRPLERSSQTSPIKNGPRSLEVEGNVWTAPKVLASPTANDSAVNDSMVRPASHVAASPSSGQSVMSKRDLDSMVRQLPPGTVARFRRQVEPFLLSRCAGCHQTGGDAAGGYEIIRGRGRVNSLTYSQRNLGRIMPMVDRKLPPDQMTFWELMVQPHATNEEPLLKADSKEASLILVWLESLSEAPVQSDWQSPISPMQPTRDSADNPARPIPLIDPFDASQGPSMEEPHLPSIGDIPSLTGNGQRTRGFVPVDPFDPEIFNRRQARKKE